MGHQAASAVADVSPFADGADSRLQRVDAALERARQLEAQAREEAENAKESADAARKVEADGESRSTQRGMKANAKSPTWWLRLSERPTST